ncbi:hypothetical protein ACSBR1_017389 [Camellia fascicularis]
MAFALIPVVPNSLHTSSIRLLPSSQGDMYVKRAAKLKEDVKRMLDKVVDPLAGLEMIDDLQRLGLFYHFEDEIKRVLDSIYNNINYYNLEQRGFVCYNSQI